MPKQGLKATLVAELLNARAVLDALSSDEDMSNSDSSESSSSTSNSEDSESDMAEWAEVLDDLEAKVLSGLDGQFNEDLLDLDSDMSSSSSDSDDDDVGTQVVAIGIQYN